MSHEKAREYFSAYYEGTLERGLKETFERALSTDAQVQAEYRAFERLMGELDVMKEPVPEPDFDLHESISRRLDKHIFEEKRRAKHPIFAWWKSAALGGLATVALVAAILQLRPNTTRDPGLAAIVPPISATERVELHSADGKFSLQYSTKGEKTVVIRASDGSVLAQEALRNGSLNSPLANQNPTAALLKVEVSGEKGETYIALPGTRMQPAASGEGSLKDMVVALAGHYRVPVMLSFGENVVVRWQFGPGDGLGAAEKALEGSKYTAQKNSDGVISIESN